jgi:hypothetical protein
MVDDMVTAQLIRACAARYEAERNAAIAETLVYLRNPVGVGDHPNLIDQISELVDKAAAADERLQIMTKFFQIQETPTSAPGADDGE